ncbi:MAG: hypothetical protein AAGI34_20085, partial [Pseudomonadota bacterium]
SLQKAGVTQQEMVFFLEALGSDLSLLLPLYQDNSTELNRLADEAEALGATMDAKTLAAMQRVDASMDRLGVATTGLGNRLVTAFAPAIETVVNALTGLVDWLGRAVSRVIQFGRQVLGVLGLIDKSREEQIATLEAERTRNAEMQLSLMLDRTALDDEEAHRLEMNNLLEQEQRLTQQIADLRKAMADETPDLPEIKPVNLPSTTGSGGGGRRSRAARDPDADRFADALKRIEGETAAIRRRTGIIGAEQKVRDAYAATVEAARVKEDLLRTAQSAQIEVTQKLSTAIDAAAEARRRAVLGEIRAETAYQKAQEAADERVQQVRGTISDVTSPLRDMLRQGEISLRSFAETVARIFQNLADRLLDGVFRQISDGLVDALNGSGSGGGGSPLGSIFSQIGSAVLGAFGGAPVAAAAPGAFGSSAARALATGGLYANGAAFRDGSVVNVPTLFPMSRGRFGMMGENGRESIMPLAKAPNGRLGIEAIGGAGADQRDTGPRDQRIIIVDSPKRAQELVRPNARDWIVEFDRLGYERKR